MGKLREFEPTVESWLAFVDRVLYHFEAEGIAIENPQPAVAGQAAANGLPAVIAQPSRPGNLARRKAILIQAMGIEWTTKARDLYGTKAAMDAVSWDEFVTRVGKLINPEPSKYHQRFKFHRRTQGATENVQDFWSALVREALPCKFDEDANDPKKARILEQFIYGLREKEMINAILRTTDFTYENILERTQTMEHAAISSEEFLRSTSAVAAVTTRHGLKTQQRKGTAKGFSRKGSSANASGQQPCRTCNRSHDYGKCPAYGSKCRKCGGMNHWAAACSKMKENPKSGVANVKEEGWSEASHSGDDNGDCEETGTVEVVGKVHGDLSEPSPRILVDLWINKKPVRMVVDTGSGITMISKRIWRLIGSPAVEPVQQKFGSASGHLISLFGKCRVSVNVKGRESKAKTMLLIVADSENVTSLFGRRWIRALGTTDNEYFTENGEGTERIQLTDQHSVDRRIKTLLDENGMLFDGELGLIKGVKGTLTVDHDALKEVNTFFKPRPVPFALENRINLELERLESKGIIERLPNDQSDFASPIVVVAKRNSDAIRMCGDFKVWVNKVIKMEHYTLPDADQLFRQLGGGCKLYTNLDLSEAYHQIEMDEDAQKLLVIATRKGLFRYKRLPFGIKSAPAIFQRVIDHIIFGIPGVVAYLDDVLIASKTMDEHVATLKQVFDRFREYGVKLALSKCNFAQRSVKYLGHVLCEEGLKTTDAKIEAVMNAPAPVNVSQLKAFLGLVTFYGKYIPMQADICAPLYKLLQKDVKWKWSGTQRNAFNRLKTVLARAPVLQLFDPKLPVGLATDASQSGVGAVLFHVMPTGEEKPIAFASATLNSSQRRWAQIEKEGYSIIFGLNKFRQYLYGRKFILVTDHKPLLAIFGAEKKIPDRTSNRLQRWALILMGYTYDLKFKSTKEHGNADALSRLPLPIEVPVDTCELEDIFAMSEYQLPMPRELMKAQVRDPLLVAVHRSMNSTWPSPMPSGLQPFYKQREWLALQNNCLFLGNRVVIPASLQRVVLEELHQGHPGMVRMKSLAREFVYWPNIDQDIDTHVKKCPQCQAVRNESPTTATHPWEFPQRPWERLHIDFAGPVNGIMWLVVVDAYSKWPEFIPMRSTTSEKTINELYPLICRFGLPSQIVSDNGPQFTSGEFQQFCNRFGIKHITVAPYHPRSNGEAERFVQILKRTLEKYKRADYSTLVRFIQRFLFTYRNTLHPTTGFSPAQLLLGKRVRMPLDNLLKRPEDSVIKSQTKQAEKGAKVREFLLGESVWVRDHRNNNVKWAMGTVVDKIGPLTYKVEVGQQLWKRHIDHMLSRDPACEVPVEDDIKFDLDPPVYAKKPLDEPDSSTIDNGETAEKPVTPAKVPTAGSPIGTLTKSSPTASHGLTNSQPSAPREDQPLRRSTRLKKEPARYQPVDFRMTK